MFGEVLALTRNPREQERPKHRRCHADTLDSRSPRAAAPAPSHRRRLRRLCLWPRPRTILGGFAHYWPQRRIADARTKRRQYVPHSRPSLAQNGHHQESLTAAPSTLLNVVYAMGGCILCITNTLYGFDLFFHFHYRFFLRHSTSLMIALLCYIHCGHCVLLPSSHILSHSFIVFTSIASTFVLLYLCSFTHAFSCCSTRFSFISTTVSLHFFH